MGFQGIDRVQPQLDTTGRVGPHRHCRGVPHAGVLWVEPDRVTVGRHPRSDSDPSQSSSACAHTVSVAAMRARITSIAHCLTAADPRATPRWIDMQGTWVSKASGPLAATSQTTTRWAVALVYAGNERCRRASRQGVSTQVVRGRRLVDRGGESDPRSSDGCHRYVTDTLTRGLGSTSLRSAPRGSAAWACCRSGGGHRHARMPSLVDP